MSEKEYFVKCFKKAIEDNAKYIGVLVEMNGFSKPEIIINERGNFEAKLAYYEKSYNDHLVLNTFSGVKIVDLASGDNANEILKQLVD